MKVRQPVWLLCVCLIVAEALACAGCGPSLPTGVKQLNVITETAFDSIQRDASYEDVVQAIGAEGTLVDPRSLPAGVTLSSRLSREQDERGGDIYCWRNEAGDMIFMVLVSDGYIQSMAREPRRTG